MIDPADRALAESKLALLAGYAGELEDLVGGSGPARVRGNVERRAAERAWLDLVDSLDDDPPTLLGIDIVRLDRADSRLRARIEKEGKVMHEHRSPRP